MGVEDIATNELFPLRLTVGHDILVVGIVVRIHEGEPLKKPAFKQAFLMAFSFEMRSTIAVRVTSRLKLRRSSTLNNVKQPREN